MMHTRVAALAAVAAWVVVASFVPDRAIAQDIARRVQSAPDGKVRFAFAVKPGVCGWGNSISRGGASSSYGVSWGGSDDVEYGSECSSSPARVVLSVRSGEVTKVRTYVGGRWKPASGVTDLGHLSTRDATQYLLGLAFTDDKSVGRDAIMPAMLADSAVVWPQLARLARDERRPRETRKQALFWLSAEAGDRVAGRRRETRDEESEIRKQAVFALSQRRDGEAVPALMQVARTNRDPEVRRTALFWLGQTSDARVVSLFEEILGR